MPHKKEDDLGMLVRDYCAHELEHRDCVMSHEKVHTIPLTEIRLKLKSP